MKKQKIFKTMITILIFIILTLLLVGCGDTKNTSTQNVSNEENIEAKQLTAEEIINKIKEKNSNIGKVIVYTEETDLNKLLGRPGQYTSKVIFEDKRLEQENANNKYLTEEERNEPTGGTIEVFKNEKDMRKRKEYIEGFSTNSMFLQYVYSKGNVLLRVEGDLTPTQAKEYENILNEIIKK